MRGNSITFEVTDENRFFDYLCTMTQTLGTQPSQNSFPEALKNWRKLRRLSQMDLALEADVSSRHISFLETGRSKPSREMVSRISDALNLPLALRNQLLAHAGFASRYPSTAWDANEMMPVRDALAYTLERHDPYPAFALDRVWTIFQANEAAKRLFGPLGVEEGSNGLELLMSDALPLAVENWPQVAHHTAQRLRTESAALGGVKELDEASQHLSKVAVGDEHSFKPVIPTVYRMGATRLALFSTLAQFGTPVDLTLDDLKIELFFPADAETKALLLQMAKD